MARPLSNGTRYSVVAWLTAGVVAGAALTGGAIVGVRALLFEESPVMSASAPLFETAGSPNHVYDGEFEHFVGGGVAVLDCNDDLFPDLYIAGGTRPAGLFINESDVGGDLALAHHPGAASDLTGVTGAYPIDIDSDRLTDLVVLRRGENIVLRGTGDCLFERANERWSIDGGDDWTVGFSAYWEEDEALPTLAFGNYLRLAETTGGNECEDHYLLRPADDISYSAPEAMSPGYCTLSILFSDWNRTGDPDLRMTNDRHYYREGTDQLWDMEDEPTQYTTAEGWNQLQIWGMGIASQDLDADGMPEVFLTSQGDNKLQTLTGDSDRPDYEDMALAAGVTAHRPFAGDTLRPSTAWHAEFDDVNNDGVVDLFVTKGNVEAQEDFASEDPNNLLLGRSDGTFVEGAEEAGLLDLDRSRGAGVVDLNLDGSLDVVVVERREPVKVWRNTGALVDGGEAGNWLLIDVGQHGTNTDAIGAWVEVDVGERVITKEITVGGGHGSGELVLLHFGLGPATEARVRVTWPDGETSDWKTMNANQPIAWKRGFSPTPLPRTRNPG